MLHRDVYYISQSKTYSFDTFSKFREIITVQKEIIHITH